MLISTTLLRRKVDPAQKLFRATNLIRDLKANFQIGLFFFFSKSPKSVDFHFDSLTLPAKNG